MTLRTQKKPLTILFINSISRHKFGGGEGWMVKAAKGLKEAGHSVTLASKRGGEILKHAKEAGVDTLVFNIRSDFSPVNTIRIARYLKKNHVDILICNLNKDVRVAGLAARLVRTPVVIARHGMLLCGNKWRHKMSLLHLTDGILTNSRTIREAYQSYGWFEPDFVEVIYNGMEIKSDVLPVDFSEPYPGKKIILAAGRLSPQKDFPTLIEAAEHLNRKRKDLVFLIAGRGGEEKALKAHIARKHLEETVHLVGYFKSIDSLLKGCDLFVLSSVFEGMPNVVMEAMAQGKAVVATDVNGVRELMEDGKTGLIVPPRDPEELAGAIESLINRPELLDQFGQAGKERVETSFTIPRMVQNLEDYFYRKKDEKTRR